jgi:hypothetical protein
LECAWIENLRNGKMFQHNLHVITSISFIGTRVSLRILSCSQGGNHTETNLANSSYMLDMKEEKEKNAFFYWQIFAKI